MSSTHDEAGAPNSDSSRARPFRYIDHDADIAIVASGETVEALFVNVARAVFEVMADTDAVEGDQRIDVSFQEDDLEFALVEWINALLAEARTHGLALRSFEMRRHHDTWFGTGFGGPWSPEGDRGVEVKGATLTKLRVQPVDEGWEGHLIVDV
jgi:SHS2 domain-containing protein